MGCALVKKNQKEYENGRKFLSAYASVSKKYRESDRTGGSSDCFMAFDSNENLNRRVPFLSIQNSKLYRRRLHNYGAEK